MKQRIVNAGILILICIIGMSPIILANPYSVNYQAGAIIGDPISAANGAYKFDMPLLHPGGPMNLSFVFSHSYDRYPESGFIHNFRHNCAPDLLWKGPEGGEPGKAYCDLANDHYLVFTDIDGEWVLDDSSPVRYVLKQVITDDVEGSFYLMDPVNELIYMFEPGVCYSPDLCTLRLKYLLDRNGNSLTYTYDSTPGTDPMAPVLIEDGLGRSLTFVYSSWLLQAVTDQAGRSISFNYDNNAPDFNNGMVLRSVTDARGKTTTFTFQYIPEEPYFAPVVALQKPEGNVPYTQVADWIDLAGTEAIRVASQTDAYSNTTTLSYDPVYNIVTETRPDTEEYIYEHYHEHGNPISITDPVGNSITSGQTTFEQLAFVTDRRGNSSVINYHDETGKISSFQNAEGQFTDYTYTAQAQTFTNPDNADVVEFTFYNLNQIDYADNTSLVFSHDSSGNVTTALNRMNKLTRYTYNGLGQILTVQNHMGGTITYTFNPDGTLASRSDPETGTTSYHYDSALRLNRIVHPDLTDVHITYNANNQFETYTDERDNVTTLTYDDNGNLTHATDDKGHSTIYEFDLMDRLVSITDRRGQTSGITYDALNRVETVTSRSGVTTASTYDARGYLDGIVFGGQTWSSVSDNEGAWNSTLTPMNNETIFNRNNLSRISGITSPEFSDVSFLRNELQQITSFTDQLDQVTIFDVNSWNSLGSITRPTVGTATYGRNDLGRVTSITDLNGENWIMNYSNLGRSNYLEDPLGNGWSQTYDNRGRPHVTTYPDSSNLTRSYDATGNLSTVTDGVNTLTYTYDPDLNRLLTADGVVFTYDNNGNLTSTSNHGTVFTATYDSASRLETVTYNGFTVTYTYDPVTGNLTEVSDDLTGTIIGFQYDSDMRMTGIFRSNGVDTTFTLDNANRLTRIQHGSIGDLQFALDAAGQITSADISVPLSPVPLMTPATETTDFDAACQVRSAGYIYDELGQRTEDPFHEYAYDEFGRLVNIDGVGLDYNGLGDMISRTDGGQMTMYHRNYALGYQPVVSLRDGAAGPWLRHFVYSPEGRLLYTINPSLSNQVLFYHFNQVGSTLFLTDINGSVTDSYAYLPYGSLLQHSGPTDQPFTFIGQWGVRQEGIDGDLYHMRARYYDAKKGCFLSRDSVWPLLDLPESLNPYQYALLNPCQVIDPLGMTPRYFSSLLDDALSGDHEIRFGVDYYTAVVDDEMSPRMKFIAYVYCDDSVNDNYLNVDYPIFEPQFSRVSAYIQDTITFGKLTANIGLRYDREIGTVNPYSMEPDYSTPYLDELVLAFEKSLNDDVALSLDSFLRKQQSRRSSSWQNRYTGLYTSSFSLDETDFFQTRERVVTPYNGEFYNNESHINQLIDLGDSRLPAFWMLELDMQSYKE